MYIYIYIYIYIYTPPACHMVSHQVSHARHLQNTSHDNSTDTHRERCPTRPSPDVANNYSIRSQFLKPVIKGPPGYCQDGAVTHLNYNRLS